MQMVSIGQFGGNMHTMPNAVLWENKKYFNTLLLKILARVSYIKD